MKQKAKESWERARLGENEKIPFVSAFHFKLIFKKPNELSQKV
jgi:hypothetical protein